MMLQYLMCCLYKSLFSWFYHCLHLCCVWLKQAEASIWWYTVLHAVPRAYSTLKWCICLLGGHIFVSGIWCLCPSCSPRRVLMTNMASASHVSITQGGFLLHLLLDMWSQWKTRAVYYTYLICTRLSCSFCLLSLKRTLCITMVYVTLFMPSCPGICQANPLQGCAPKTDSGLVTHYCFSWHKIPLHDKRARSLQLLPIFLF